MAELNNEEIRFTLQDLVSSPDFDVNDPDTKRQLNSILSQINVYNYLNHNKNYIGIRTLSVNEYTKYIEQGTCDGSIIKDDINVWHYTKNPIGNSYAATFSNGSPEGFNISYLTHPVVYLGQMGSQTKNYNYIITYEICSTNSSNQHIVKNQQQCICDAIVGNYDSTYRRYNYVQDRQTLPVNYSINKSGIQQLIKNITYGNATVRFTFNISIMFRPVFFYIDNNKSKNIYY